MQKWEYYWFQCQTVNEQGRFLPKVYPEGHQCDVVEFINGLGADGWELVSVVGNDAGHSQEFYFKRPR